MKKMIIVNNNMKVGGVQKSLCNLLWSVADQFDITLYLFSRTGAYAEDIPPAVKVVSCTSMFRFFGISQEECKGRFADRMIRGFMAALCRLFGRPFVIRMISPGQNMLPDRYDVAISYLQNGRLQNLYGGTNEFVLQKINAGEKIAFLHCDYHNCGADHPENNRLYASFDKIAACSEGCRSAFLKVLPDLTEKTFTVRNFHRKKMIMKMAAENPKVYEETGVHLVVVGRLAHEKAVDRAVRAVAYSEKKGFNVFLHIIGDGNMRDQLDQLAVSLNVRERIRFYGEQKNPYRYMANADLLLVTSLHEAAPMVIDEAYIIGLPVLTVETTSSREMVAERTCGWVCENSQEGLNECLVQILAHVSDLRNMREDLRSREKNNDEAFMELENLLGESYAHRTGKTNGGTEYRSG